MAQTSTPRSRTSLSAEREKGEWADVAKLEGGEDNISNPKRNADNFFTTFFQV